DFAILLTGRLEGWKPSDGWGRLGSLASACPDSPATGRGQDAITDPVCCTRRTAMRDRREDAARVGRRRRGPRSRKAPGFPVGVERTMPSDPSNLDRTPPMHAGRSDAGAEDRTQLDPASTRPPAPSPGSL